MIKPTDSEWSAEQLAYFEQRDLFRASPARKLEKVPFYFKYEFRCADASCTGHTLTCTDREIGQTYRKWQREYGSKWEQAFRQKYVHEMMKKFDTHFFVGTMHQYPRNWIIVGLFYPPPETSSDLFA